MIEDELLKLRFKAGRADALKRIYEKYRDGLLTLAMAVLNDAGLAEDVVHDVFVSFAQSGTKFGIRGNLRSYLSTCVVNRARDYHRAQKRQRRDRRDNTPVATAAGTPEQRIIADEQSQRMAKTLGWLPYEQREVIALHLNAQMNFKEIAKIQNLPLSTVRGRYRHGIERLRSILDGGL